jgi:hypothetical protein
MMTRDLQTVSAQPGEELVAALRQLLDEQVTRAREGDLSRVEELGQLANVVVMEIGRYGDAACAAMEAQREELKRLYRELVLALTAERADVEARLKRLRRVRRAVGIYGGTARA